MLELERARELARAALANLELHRQRLDDLNVYPVPDGDTGTNLTLTVRAIVAAIEESGADRPETLATEITRAALLGSRGNSGVIFSQIVRGFAEVAGEHERIDSPVLARAFRSASDTAYGALRKPVEGDPDRHSRDGRGGGAAGGACAHCRLVSRPDRRPW